MKMVVQGEDPIFKIQLGSRDKCAEVATAVDISGITTADSKVCWKAGTTVIEKTFDDADITITDAAKGKFEAVLDAAESVTLLANEVGDIEVLISEGGRIKKYQLLKSFQVKAAICP